MKAAIGLVCLAISACGRIGFDGSGDLVQDTAAPLIEGLPTAGSVVVTGTPRAEISLTAELSGFSPGTPTYAWQRCSTAACASPIPIGSSSPTYTAAGADVDNFIRVLVFVAYDCAGCGSSPTVSSPATTIVEGVAPIAGTATASAPGSPIVGDLASASAAGFSLGTPLAAGYTYVWQRCTTPNCVSATTIGGDTASYSLVAADAGSYVRVGILASNSCASGCGSSSTTYSAAVGPIRGVTLAKGATCSVTGCTTTACHWYRVSIPGFSAAAHSVTCNASNTTNPYYSFSESVFPSEGWCCYGFPGQSTWVFVDGVRSNTLVW
jgi:hypothetical protein